VNQFSVRGYCCTNPVPVRQFGGPLEFVAIVRLYVSLGSVDASLIVRSGRSPGRVLRCIREVGDCNGDVAVLDVTERLPRLP